MPVGRPVAGFREGERERERERDRDSRQTDRQTMPHKWFSTAESWHLSWAVCSVQLMSLGDLVSRFRPNLVVSGNGMMPYEEDEWSEVTIGGQKFKVSDKENPLTSLI